MMSKARNFDNELCNFVYGFLMLNLCANLETSSMVGICHLQCTDTKWTGNKKAHAIHPNWIGE